MSYRIECRTCGATVAEVPRIGDPEGEIMRAHVAVHDAVPGLLDLSLAQLLAYFSLADAAGNRA